MKSSPGKNRPLRHNPSGLVKLDLLMASLAWVVAAATILSTKLPLHMDTIAVYGFYVLPGIWLLCIAIAYIFRNRPLKKLWWMYLSAPFALCYWIFIFFIVCSFSS